MEGAAMSLDASRRCVAVVLSVLGLVAGPPPTSRAEEHNAKNVLVTGPDALLIVQALAGARRKLENPACQQLLTDYTDAEGRTLGENLGSRTPADYLGRLVIRDGEIPKGSHRCWQSGAGAFTPKATLVVFVCGANFRSLSPRLRENALIHEMLHSLGLGQNPPTSQDISRQVANRCGI
jgi:hypothetical protein